jgi:iron-sulfur cluster assembly protein
VFTLTPTAAAQIRRSAEQQTANPALRVAAKHSEAGEVVYGMGFDEERENDLVVQCEGVTVLIAPLSQPLLDATTLDFVELTPGEFQFIFVGAQEAPPPAPQRSGGCGGGGCGGGCGR